MLTVKEYWLSTASMQVVGIHDGWRPLCLRYFDDTQSLVLLALVNTEAKEEAEVFRVLVAGTDLGGIQTREGIELAFLGAVPLLSMSMYLFLDVKPAVADATERRPGRLDLEDFLKKGVDKSR